MYAYHSKSFCCCNGIPFKVFLLLQWYTVLIWRVDILNDRANDICFIVIIPFKTHTGHGHAIIIDFLVRFGLVWHLVCDFICECFEFIQLNKSALILINLMKYLIDIITIDTASVRSDTICKFLACDLLVLVKIKLVEFKCREFLSKFCFID
eukprot:871406_1